MKPSARRASPAGLEPTPPAALQPPDRHPCTSRLAAPRSRLLLALLFLVAIWLPSLLLTHGTDPDMLMVNVALTGACLLILRPRRTRRPS